MNEKLSMFVQVAPMLKLITGVDASIGIWDENGVVQEYIKAEGLDLYFKPGTRIDNPEVGLYRVLRTGKPEVERLPKEIIGADIECTITPIFDGNDVVGAITYSFSSEIRDRIDVNVDKLAGFVENTGQYISQVNDGAENLKTNMGDIQEITEIVANKLGEALGVVEEIKQNAKLSNILALNASIESARAGEAGKGFAVVSDEMRKFSRMSAEASEKINSTLADISKSLNNAKTNISDSYIIANNQASSVSELDNVFKDVRNTADQILRDTKVHTNIYK